MPRLLRPHVPIEVRCRVAMEQLGEMFSDEVLAAHKSKAALLVELLTQLRELLGGEPLALDHNPALALRAKIIRNGVHVGYRPAANDPEHLIYRTRAAHLVKTNHHGDGAQHPDRVLIKRERRRTRKTPKRKFKWPPRPLRSAARWPKRKMSQPSTGDRKS